MKDYSLRAKNFSVENYLEEAKKLRKKSVKSKRKLKKITSIVITFALATLDFAVIYQVNETAMEQNQLMQVILSIGMALLLNFIPYYTADFFIEWQYGLRKQAKFFAILGIVAFIGLYAVISYQRYAFRDMFAVEKARLVNTVASDEEKDIEKPDKETQTAESKATGTMLLLIIEPLVTSILSFIISYKTNNKLEEKLEETEGLAKDLKQLESELTCAIKELESTDYEGLKENDRLKFESMKEFVHNHCDRLKVNARMSLAKYLKEAEAVSALCVTKETDNN